MKRVLFLSVLLIVLLGAGYFAWQYFSKSADGGLSGIFAPQPPPLAPQAATGPVQKVSSGALVAYFTNDTATVGVEPNGRVIKIESGASAAISTASIDTLISASFSFDGKKILAKFGSKTDPLWSIFDVSSAIWTPITDMKLSAAAWAPDSQTIAYLEKVNDKNNLGTLRLAAPVASSSPTTEKKAVPPPTGGPTTEPARKTLATIALSDYDIFWLLPDEIILSAPPSKTAPAFALRYTIKDGVFSPVTYNEAGTLFKWDTRSGQGLKFYTEKNKNYLMLVDGTGSHLQELNFITLPNKCAFQDNSVYCGIPRSGPPARIVLPDDYLKMAYFSSDDFYKINLSNGSIARILDSAGESIDATDLSLRGSSLYFLNRLDGELYKFEVPASIDAD